MQKRSLLLLMALTSVFPSKAATFTAGTWYNILTSAGVDAAPGVSGGSGVNAYLGPGALPWSFILLAAGTLDVVDAENPGDTYRVETIGAGNVRTVLGVTIQSIPFSPNVSCGFNPQECFDTPLQGGIPVYSKRTFDLAASTAYSLQFIAIDSPSFSSNAFFRINGTIGTETPVEPGPIPEPTTYALTGTAFAALAWLKARKR